MLHRAARETYLVFRRICGGVQAHVLFEINKLIKPVFERHYPSPFHTYTVKLIYLILCQRSVKWPPFLSACKPTSYDRPILKVWNTRLWDLENITMPKFWFALKKRSNPVFKRFLSVYHLKPKLSSWSICSRSRVFLGFKPSCIFL